MTATSTLGYAAIRVVASWPLPHVDPILTCTIGSFPDEHPHLAFRSDTEAVWIISGPMFEVARLTVHWPSALIVAIIGPNGRLPFTAVRERATCSIPLLAATPGEARSAYEIHTHLDDPDLPLRVEHNHPSRRAGWFAENPWVGNEAAACINYLFAARCMLRDWGIHRHIARNTLGRMEVLGFESNNPLHPENPPHWHLLLYHSDSHGVTGFRSPGTRVPHFAISPSGGISANKCDTFGATPESDRRDQLLPLMPMEVKDKNGTLLYTAVITQTGGLDFISAQSEHRYGLRARQRSGLFSGCIDILRNDAPWRTICAHDDVDHGVLRIAERSTVDGRQLIDERIHYDVLTGKISMQRCTHVSPSAQSGKNMAVA